MNIHIVIPTPSIGRPTHSCFRDFTSRQESLFECSFDEEVEGVAVVMVEDASSLSEVQFQETLARQRAEREATRRRQCRERYELHRWYVRHGRSPPKLPLESIYFSSFFLKSTHTHPSTSDTSAPKEAEESHVNCGAADSPRNAIEATQMGTHFKSLQQSSFSSEDENYNSIEKHFNRGEESNPSPLNPPPHNPPKSPWEVAYNKRAEQLALLQSLQHSFDQTLLQQQYPAVGQSYSDGLIYQLQQLLNRKQQLTSQTQMIYNLQQQIQLQQQKSKIVEQLTELLRCNSQQNGCLSSSPLAMHHQGFYSPEAQLQQELTAKQKAFCEHLKSSITQFPSQVTDPRVHSESFNKVTCDFLSPSSFSALMNGLPLQRDVSTLQPPTNAHLATDHVPFQPVQQHPWRELYLNRLERMNLGALSMQDRMELFKLNFQPLQQQLHNGAPNFPPQFQMPPGSFLPDLHDHNHHHHHHQQQHHQPQQQQQQHCGHQDQIALLQQQIALLQLLLKPNLGAKQDFPAPSHHHRHHHHQHPPQQHAANSSTRGSRTDGINDVIECHAACPPKYLSASRDVPLGGGGGCCLESQIQALITSISASLKS